MEPTIIQADNEDDFTNEQLQTLEERWQKYLNNPASAMPAEEFNEQLKQKYGK